MLIYLLKKIQSIPRVLNLIMRFVSLFAWAPKKDPHVNFTDDSLSYGQLRANRRYLEENTDHILHSIVPSFNRWSTSNFFLLTGFFAWNNDDNVISQLWNKRIFFLFLFFSIRELCCQQCWQYRSLQVFCTKMCTSTQKEITT